jgi:ribosomal protein L32E
MAATACTSAPPPKPEPARPPDASEKLVADLTKWLKLDANQQAKTREFARDLIARNEKIMERWQQTKKPHSEELLASNGQFQSELLSILTPEQKKTYTETARRVMAKGQTVPSRPPS